MGILLVTQGIPSPNFLSSPVTVYLSYVSPAKPQNRSLDITEQSSPPPLPLCPAIIVHISRGTYSQILKDRGQTGTVQAAKISPLSIHCVLSHGEREYGARKSEIAFSGWRVQQGGSLGMLNPSVTSRHQSCLWRPSVPPTSGHPGDSGPHLCLPGQPCPALEARLPATPPSQRPTVRLSGRTWHLQAGALGPSTSTW